MPPEHGQLIKASGVFGLAGAERANAGRRLVRIVRRGHRFGGDGRRAQIVLLSAQGMGVAGIAKVAFTSEDRVRDVIRMAVSRYKGARPPKFTLCSGGRSSEPEVIFCVDLCRSCNYADAGGTRPAAA
jgi:hypothetical protein